MTQLENFLQAWWQAEALSPAILPESNLFIKEKYITIKIKKFHRVDQSRALPVAWDNIKFKRGDVKQHIGLYGNCFIENDLIAFQRDLHDLKDAIHNVSMKKCYSFYLEFDEDLKYIENTLFIPHVNICVKLAYENALTLDDQFFQTYEDRKTYLNDQ